MSPTAGVAAGELDLACGRPASAAEAFQLAELGGRRKKDELKPADLVALARNPALVELVPGVRATVPVRTAIALGLARARAQLLDDDEALHAAEDAVAATGSGAAGCAAQLLLAAAYRTRARVEADLEPARAAEERAEAALEGCARDAGALRILHAAIAASRARTRFAGAFMERGFLAGEVGAAAQLLGSRADEGEGSDGKRLEQAFGRLQKAAPARGPNEASELERDPLLDDLVGRSRAELLAALALRPLVELDGPGYADSQRRHSARALRAAVLARERDPSSPAAYAALARAWIGCGLPPQQALDLATHARLLPPRGAPEPLVARAVSRLALSQDADSLKAAAADFDEAETQTRALGLRELEEDEALFRLHSQAADAFEAARAFPQALVERQRVGKLADDRLFTPRSRASLHRAIARIARKSGATELATKEENGPVKNAEAQITTLDNVIGLAEGERFRFWKAFGQEKADGYNPEVIRAIFEAFSIARTDARLVFNATFACGWSPNGMTFQSFSANALASELDSEMGHHSLVEVVVGARQMKYVQASGYRHFAEPDWIDPDRGELPREVEDPRLPLHADPDLRATEAYVVALSQNAGGLPSQLGLKFARKLLRRRPELRTAHIFLGRLLTFVGDGRGALEELELAADLPRLLDESPPPATDHPVAGQTVAALLEFIAEAHVGRGWPPTPWASLDAHVPHELSDDMREKARAALRLATVHRYRYPERIRLRFDGVFPDRELDEICGQIARAAGVPETKKER